MRRAGQQAKADALEQHAAILDTRLPVAPSTTTKPDSESN
jgi:hypothetical protein